MDPMRNRLSPAARLALLSAFLALPIAGCAHGRNILSCVERQTEVAPIVIELAQDIGTAQWAEAGAALLERVGPIAFQCALDELIGKAAARRAEGRLSAEDNIRAHRAEVLKRLVAGARR